MSKVIKVDTEQEARLILVALQAADAESFLRGHKEQSQMFRKLWEKIEPQIDREKV